MVAVDGAACLRPVGTRVPAAPAAPAAEPRVTGADTGQAARTVPAEIADGLATGRYVTTTTACARLGGGVHPTMVRDWIRRTSVPLDVVRDEHGEPVRVPGRRGLENVLEWAAVEAVNARLAASKRGRPRRVRTA